MVRGCGDLSISFIVFFVKQKAAYEMRISDWSSDVCSSDLDGGRHCIAQPDLDGLGLDRPGYGVLGHENGRASCRESVCQYVLISVVAVSLKIKLYYNTISQYYHN